MSLLLAGNYRAEKGGICEDFCVMSMITGLECSLLTHLGFAQTPGLCQIDLAYSILPLHLCTSSTLVCFPWFLWQMVPSAVEHCSFWVLIVYMITSCSSFGSLLAIWCLLTWLALAHCLSLPPKRYYKHFVVELTLSRQTCFNLYKNANKCYSKISGWGSLAWFSEVRKANRRMGRKSTGQKNKKKKQTSYDIVCTGNFSYHA